MTETFGREAGIAHRVDRRALAGALGRDPDRNRTQADWDGMIEEVRVQRARIGAALALIDEFRGGRPVPPTSMAALVRAALTGEEATRG